MSELQKLQVVFMKNLSFVWRTSPNEFTMEIVLRKIYSIRLKLSKKCLVLKKEWKRLAHLLRFRNSSVIETYLYFILIRIIQNFIVILLFIILITFFYSYRIRTVFQFTHISAGNTICCACTFVIVTQFYAATR